jgi:hypothetical protein
MAGKDSDFVLQKMGVNTDDIATISKGARGGQDLYKGTFGKFVKGSKGGKSIIGMAAKNTFEFPVFVSSSVPLDYATATCSLLEQNYASYLQIAIAQDPMVDSRDIKSGGYLSQFKTNTTKYVEYAEEPYEFESCHNVVVEDDKIFEFDMITIEDEEARFINEMCSYEPLSEFDHFFVEADDNGPKRLTWFKFEKIYVTNRMNPIQYKEAQELFAKYNQAWDEADAARLQVAQLKKQNNGLNGQQVADKAQAELRKAKAEADKLEADITDFIKKYNLQGKDKVPDHEDEVIAKRKAAVLTPIKMGQEILKLQKEIQKLDNDLEKQEIDNDGYDAEVNNRREKLRADAAKAGIDASHAEQRFDMEKARNAREAMRKAPEMMDETKINKLNTLKPLMMKCQVMVNNQGGTDYPMELVLGVKCHCRLIDAETLPEVAKYPIKEMNELTRKVKYKAGELKFFKDIVFNIKEKKQSAIDNKDPKKRWYRRLYKLAHMKGDSFVSGSISGNKRSGLIPNATMIITNSDVENVKAATDIDLLKGSTAKKFCDELFLMAIVVIDQDRESVKMLQPETHSDYEVHSIAALNKKLAELDTAGTKTRDMFKLLG